MKASFYTTIGFALVLTTAAFAQNAADIETVRTKVQEWVKTRQLISDEKAEWKAEKQAMQDTLDLLNSELTQLTSELEAITKDSSDSDGEIEELVDQKDQLRAAADLLEKEIASLEQSVLKLTERFPPPLQATILQLKNRIPTTERGAAKRTLGERMLNIVGILNTAEKFDNTVTFDGETRTIGGESVQVNVLYIGLGAAYYVDKSGSRAGIATIGADGWSWKEANDSADTIANLFAVYERTADAAFVSLPAEIQ